MAAMSDQNSEAKIELLMLYFYVSLKTKMTLKPSCLTGGVGGDLVTEVRPPDQLPSSAWFLSRVSPPPPPGTFLHLQISACPSWPEISPSPAGRGPPLSVGECRCWEGPGGGWRSSC